MHLSVHDVAVMFQVSENTVTRWLRNEGLPGNNVGGEFRFNIAQVLQWVAARGVPNNAGLVRALEENQHEPPNLAEALYAGGILQRVAGPDKRSAIHEILQALVLPADADRGQLQSILMARENLGLCLLGDGVGIPSPSFPLIMPRSKPAMTLCFLQKPLTCDGSQARTLDTIFLLVSPTMHSHLSLVARLAAALQDLEFRDLIKRRHSHDHIFRAAHRLQNLYPTTSRALASR